MSEPERFYISSKPTIIEGFRALRAAIEKILEARGETLDPAWYDDGPEYRPNLDKDQPELLNSAPTEGESQ